MTTRLALLFYAVAALHPLLGQTRPDSLTVKSYNYLLERIEDNAGNPAVAGYLKAYMDKARRENNPEEIYYAYKSYLYESSPENRLLYTDSLVFAAEKTHQNELIGDAYLTRGVIQYNLRNHIKALDNYLIANRYIATVKDDYLKFKAKYNIALIKYYLGYYNEALSLFLESTAYFREADQRAYANCLHHLALTYNRLGRIEQSIVENAKALEVSRSIAYQHIIPHITLLEGVNCFYKDQYNTAVVKIQHALPELRRKDDFGALSVAYFYLGESNWNNNNKTKAVQWFQTMDRVVEQNKYIRPDLRPAYDRLIAYFHENGLIDKELIYIKKLLRLDKRIESNFKYLSEKVHKGYDTFSLMESKARIEQELSKGKAIQNLSFAAITILITGIGYAIYSHYRLQRKYRQRFEEFRREKGKAAAIAHPPSAGALDINPEVVKTILVKLTDFEQARGFTEKEITAESLAKVFETNSKYLTRIIRHSRKKNFKRYLNDLRIDYIVRLLEENQKFRRYTNTALAEEAGYSTTQHFTRAFIAKIRIPPSYFIQQLEKTSKKKIRNQ